MSCLGEAYYQAHLLSHVFRQDFDLQIFGSLYLEGERKKMENVQKDLDRWIALCALVHSVTCVNEPPYDIK